MKRTDRRAFLKILFIGVLLAIAGGAFLACASGKQYVPFPDQGVAVEDAAKARVYIVRPTGYGGAVTIPVYVNGERIGKTKGHGCLCWEMEPGRVEILSKAENKDDISFDAVAGQVYVVRQHIKMGIMKARNELELVMDEGKREKFIMKCRIPKVDLGN